MGSTIHDIGTYGQSRTLIFEFLATTKMGVCRQGFQHARVKHYTSSVGLVMYSTAIPTDITMSAISKTGISWGARQ